MASKNQPRKKRPKPRGWRLWVFRLAAVMISLSPLVVCEIVLRIGGWGEATEIEDPYIGFSDVRPLFELNDAGGVYEIAASRREFFDADQFAAHKSDHEFRIFVLGGSTVQGEPYLNMTSFTTWLELSLQAADSTRNWRVVNCGGVSYASYRLVPILQEVLKYEPDLVILYTGHNEFLEARSYEHLKNTPEFVANAHNTMSNFRTYSLGRRLWLNATGKGAEQAKSRHIMPAEVDALLERDEIDESKFASALDDYQRDDAWRRNVVEHFQFNLRRMVHLTREANVPLIVVKPSCNLKNCYPFKVESSDDLTDESHADFDRLWNAANELGLAKPRETAKLLEQAVALDDRHAGAQFLLGHCYLEMGQVDEAKAAFVGAKEEDICPLRITEPLRDAIDQVARDTNTPLVDMQALFEDLSPRGITGEELFVDHVHPTIRGHKQIGLELLSEMARRGYVSPAPGWQNRLDEIYTKHEKTLPPNYYIDGQQRLEGVRLFTQGRARRIPGKRK